MLSAIIATALLALFLALLTAYYFNSHYSRLAQGNASVSKLVSLTRGGSLNRKVVKYVEFDGYAKGRGSLSGKYIILKNSGKYDWSNLAMYFNFPVDFSNKAIALATKSNIGGEKINIVLKDSHNKSSRLRDIFLTSNWRNETISLNSVKNDIDLSSIVQARIECDYVGEPAQGTGPTSDVTIYIKNIDLIKEAGL
jgi:hypothetical protein